MKKLSLLMVVFLLPTIPAAAQTQDSWDRGYDLMREAYQLRQAGEEEAAREKMARALALFRQSAAERTSLTFRPEVDLEIEEGPLGVNLIENRSLFKIEFRSVPPPPADVPAPARQPDPGQEAVLRLQQLIVQNLAQVIQDTAEMKVSLSLLENTSDETTNISDLVSEIRDETSEMTEVSQTVGDIRDRTDDIYDEVERLASDSDTLRAVEDLSGEISDLRDALDLLRDILDIVQDIKDDTDMIRDLESRIDDVKSEVENLKE